MPRSSNRVSWFVSSVIILFSLNYVCCFRAARQIQTKIVGGMLDATEKAPYQVSLQVMVQRQNATQFHHFCGGSIVSPSYILTAAHCLSGFPTHRISVVAGTKVWNQNGVRHAVHSYEVHEKYVKLKGYDIGLIRLEQPLTFGPKINSITFDAHFVEPDTECILTGWGYTLPIRDPGLLPNWVHAMLKSYPKELQITELRTISNEVCRETYGSMALDTELCTYKWGTGACSGDSGGPLVNLDRDRLLGVVSFGFVYCGGYTGFPDGFSRVSNFSSWINDRILAKQPSTTTLMVDSKPSEMVVERRGDLSPTQRQ